MERTRGLTALALTCLVLSGCAGAAATPDVTASPAASATAQPSEVATPTPAPMLESTTAEANEAPPGAITLTMSGARFLPAEVTAETGTVVFFLTNEIDPAAHNMLIGTDTHSPPLAKSETLLATRSAIFTVHGLEPGTYAFWCSLAGHLEFGMVGTLTVTE